jgi:hypothetical protein
MNPAKFCKQSAIYWAPTGVGSEGQDTYSTEPVVMKARWDEATEEELRRLRRLSEFIGVDEVEGKTVVMLDTDVEAGGLLMKGDDDTLAGLGVGYVPKITDAGIGKIVVFLKNPTLNAKYFLRRAYV